MNNIERFTTLKLEFSRVAWYLGNILSALLGREIHCTAKADNACIFLKDNRCSVQEAKPLACRLYPFMVDPNEFGGFRYLYSKGRG